MVFWTWAKGLEDKFDGANRRNLRHFISKVVSEKISSPSALTSRPLSSRIVDFKGDITAAKLPESNPPAEEQEMVETVQLFLDVGGQENVLLTRMSTMAVFHKLSSGKGVPHTFYGFLKQWPALPRVVVSLFVGVLVIVDFAYLPYVCTGVSFCANHASGPRRYARTLPHQ
jgi:KUP system potassium uptake protein